MTPEIEQALKKAGESGYAAFDYSGIKYLLASGKYTDDVLAWLDSAYAEEELQDLLGPCPVCGAPLCFDYVELDDGEKAYYIRCGTCAFSYGANFNDPANPAMYSSVEEARAAWKSKKVYAHQ